MSTENSEVKVGPLTRRSFLKLAGTGAIGVTALQLAACAPQATEAPAATEPPAVEEEAPAQEALTPLDNFILAGVATPPGFDPDLHVSPESQTVKQAGMFNILRYNPLDTIDPSAGCRLEDFGNLASFGLEDWQITNDGKTAVFTVRPGIMSHHGNELTAEDIAYTWERALNAGGTGSYYMGTVLQLSDASAWEIIDKYTIQITVANPHPLLHRVFADTTMVIVDSVEALANATDDDPWSLDYLAGNLTGHNAYKMQEYSPGQQAIMVPFEDYNGPVEQRYKEFIYREVPDSANRLALLLSGDIDATEVLTPRELAEADGTDGVSVLGVRNGNDGFMITFGIDHPPMDSKEVRQALNFATPVEDIIEAVFRGFGGMMRTPVPPVYPGGTEEYWNFDYDPDRARQMLRDAGVEEGSTFTLAYQLDSTLEEELAILVQSAWRDVGIELELEKVPTATFFDRLFKREFQLALWRGNAIVPDPGYVQALWFHGSSFINSGGYDNPTVNELIDGSMQGFSADQALSDERLDLLQQCQAELMEDPPWVYLGFHGPLHAVRDWVKDWVWYTQTQVPILDASKV